MMRRRDCVGRCSLCVNLPTTRSLYLSEIRTKQVEFAVIEVAVKNPVGKKVHFLLYDISSNFISVQYMPFPFCLSVVCSKHMRTSARMKKTQTRFVLWWLLRDLVDSVCRERVQAEWWILFRLGKNSRVVMPWVKNPFGVHSFAWSIRRR